LYNEPVFNDSILKIRRLYNWTSDKTPSWLKNDVTSKKGLSCKSFWLDKQTKDEINTKMLLVNFLARRRTVFIADTNTDKSISFK
jgi:hypothetical protein